jgi:predicted transcriptional regulator
MELLTKNLKINDIIRDRGLTKSELAWMAHITLNDFYQATNGRKTFFPAWRKRISTALEMSEDEVFPEYIKI